MCGLQANAAAVRDVDVGAEHVARYPRRLQGRAAEGCGRSTAAAAAQARARPELGTTRSRTTLSNNYEDAARHVSIGFTPNLDYTNGSF